MLKNLDMDMRYIEGWLKEFDATSNEKIFLTTFKNILK
jgi:hypothetical protein